MITFSKPICYGETVRQVSDFLTMVEIETSSARTRRHRATVLIYGVIPIGSGTIPTHTWSIGVSVMIVIPSGVVEIHFFVAVV